MTVLKEPISVRPSSQHRHSSSIANSLPKNRQHSHSLSVGSIHSAHRLTRRKSMSSTAAANLNPMAAAAKGITGAPLETTASARRSSKSASVFRGPPMSNLSAMASSVPSHASPFSPGSYAASTKSEAVTDGPPLATMQEHQDRNNSKSRIRRASEGSRLAKGDGKRTSGSELKCDKCGKGYKHSSCLTKHLWEHTPEWQYTSKLLISKHQQVQLLEAASVLVAMNQEADAARESDHSSASPPASGSELRDDLSSADTTPPPTGEEHAIGSYSRSHYAHRSIKRNSAHSSAAYSQSYQSTIFSDHGHSGHYRQWSNVSDRPTTSGTSIVGSYQEDLENDQADLAAAVGLLSCSYGTPKSGPVALPPDVPPVPPLPAKFQGFGHMDSLSRSSTTVTAQQSSMRGTSYPYHHNATRDVDMDDDFAEEDEYRTSHSGSRGRADDDEDGVFGRMEE